MTQLFSRRRAFLIFRTRRSKTAASSISSPPIKRTSGLRWPFNSCQVSKYLPQDRYFSDTQCSILLILASLVIYGAIMLLFSDGSGFLYSMIGRLILKFSQIDFQSQEPNFRVLVQGSSLSDIQKDYTNIYTMLIERKICQNRTMCNNNSACVRIILVRYRL